MSALMAAGSVFFPGLFLLSKQTLKHIMGWSEGDAAIVSTRLVSSVQAVMASSAGWIIASSCRDVVEDSHWLTDTYILFATPYFAYDIYAMFLCYRHRLQVKGHEEGGAAVVGYLRREKLMVLHHVFMVAFCFPASLLWRQGKGDFFQGVLFLAELSTPCVCLAKVLIQVVLGQVVLGLPGFLLPGGVHLNETFVMQSCSILNTCPSHFRRLHASIPLYAVPLVAPWQCNLGAALLWPLQLYWFTLICRGALRPSVPAGRSTSTCKDEPGGCLTTRSCCRSHQEDGH
ncbi:ceramide synthase-like [Sander vitreus]